MTKNVKTQLNKVIGKSLNGYHAKGKPKLDELKFKEQYQGRIIDCMVGEVDDNYIETPSTDNPIVKLEHSKEGVVKAPSMKGKTILVDAEGNETDTPAEGCRLVSVGENEDNKIIILSKSPNLVDLNKFTKGTTRVSNFNVDNEKGRVSITTNSGLYPFIKYEAEEEIVDLFRNKNVVMKYTVAQKPSNARPIIQAFCKSESRPDGFWISNGKLIPSDITSISFQIYGNNTNETEVTGTTVYEGVFIGVENLQFTPFACHKTEILLDEPLRRIDNNVYDEVVGNKIIKRVGKVVLDGSENWYLHKQEEPNGLTAFRVSNIVNSPKNNSFVRGLSNLLPFYNWGSRPWAIKHSSIAIDGHSLIYMYTIPNDNLQDFKQRLSENPIELLYELAEPVIVEMPNTLTLQGFDDTTMYIENEIAPTVQYGYNALIPYKKELKMQQQEVETNTLDIERNIIPYLMDMEMNLMLMEDN